MELKQLIQAILLRCEAERTLPPLKTRLTKLIYMAEVEYFRRTGKRLTPLAWQFHHFGPYAHELTALLGDPSMDAINAELLLRQIADKPLSLDHDVAVVVKDVVHRWGDEDLNQFLDYVYFETEPMQAANRGERLDFTRISRDKPLVVKKVVIDSSKLKKMRAVLRERANSYAAMRQPAVSPEDSYLNFEHWDRELRKPVPPAGTVYLDPSKLIDES